jgi:ketosteroid isomerase-like protein
MSEENVDSFLAHVEAVNRWDVPGLLRFVDPQIHFEPQVAVLQGSYAGYDGVREFFADVFETFEVFEVNFPDVRDLGDRVLALGTVRTIGKGSGVDQEAPLAIVMAFRDGRITHFKDYGDKDNALEAAGLRD